MELETMFPRKVCDIFSITYLVPGKSKYSLIQLSHTLLKDNKYEPLHGFL